MSDKFCKDCKNYSDMGKMGAGCKLVYKCLVTGKSKEDVSCYLVRHTEGYCGADGKYFESREEK